jgi:hypothetical protein
LDFKINLFFIHLFPFQFAAGSRRVASDAFPREQQPADITRFKGIRYKNSEHTE